MNALLVCNCFFLFSITDLVFSMQRLLIIKTPLDIHEALVDLSRGFAAS